MLEKLPFSTLLLSAWRASLSHKLPWIFGSFLAIATVAERQIGLMLPATASSQESLDILASKSPETILFFFLIFVLLFGLEIFGKSNLIVSLSFLTGKAHLPNHPNSFPAIGINFFRALSVECLALLFLLVMIGVFSLPFLIASSENPGAMNTLLGLGILAFVPIAITVFLIKQFALFYLLLSPLKIRGSLETGSALFSRFLFPTFLFGLFSFVLAALFTFCVNIVILNIALLAKMIGLPTEATPIAISLALFAWFSIFQQALWLAFFKSIAGSNETKELVKEKDAAFDNQSIPEIPPAQ